MWFLVGITVLLTGASMANITDENGYYLAETNEERSMDVIEKSRYERSELGASTGARRSDVEQQQPGSSEPSNYTGIRNSDKKRSIVKINVRDRSSTQLQAPTSLSTLLFWPHGQGDELVSMEQRRNPTIQERRNPLFSPWGGKRDMQRYRTIAKTRRPVRVPFNSWGGKRNGGSIQGAMTDLKRGKFFNWGGKKAPPFNSWGGKRDTGIDFRLLPLNKHQHHRTDLRQREQLRTGEDRNDFGSAEESYSEKVTSNETWEKRGSLRPLTGGEMTTSGSTLGNSFQRTPFEPWGGKKRGELRFHDDVPAKAGVSVITRKIGRFIPWTE